jgi:hypothetical protein
MIDRALLRELGWSDDLINEISGVAETIRGSDNLIPDIGVCDVRPFSVGSTVLYSDSVLNKTLKEYRVADPQLPSSDSKQ